MGISFSFPEGFQTFLSHVYNTSDCLFGKDTETRLLGSLSFKEKILQSTPSGSTNDKERCLENIVFGSSSFKARAFQRNGFGSIRIRVRKLERNASGCSSVKESSQDAVPSRSKSFTQMDSKMFYLESTCFKGNKGLAETKRPERTREKSLEASSNSASCKQEEAALKLQKVYKSYRTRRNLADCAVLVEELWWQAIDFVTLKRSTVSFFDIRRQDSASSRWARARLKAAKVGKGLSKDDKARKLAFQHWLEAIDPRHRYGHNLHFYYDEWFDSDTAEPFFYWLDVGEGRNLNLNSCPRAKLQQQCIRYLGPKEREQYEVTVEDGRLFYKQSKEPIHTLTGSKWIFVLSTSKKFYVGQKSKGTFQHSSFLAGGAASAAGRLVAEEGILKSIWPYSGHYLPTEENFNEFVSFLEEKRVNLTNVQKTPADEDDQSLQFAKNVVIESKPVFKPEEEDQPLIGDISKSDMTQECRSHNSSLIDTKTSTLLHTNCTAKPVELGNMVEHCSSVESTKASINASQSYLANSDGSNIRNDGDCAEKGNLSAEEEVNREELPYKRSLSDKNLDTPPEVPQDSLLNRLDSKRSLQSYQLGKKVSIKWSTGAGPRIICVKDYPSELRVKALEKVNLSPKLDSTNCSPKPFSDISRQNGSPKPLSDFSRQNGSPKPFSDFSRQTCSPKPLSDFSRQNCSPKPFSDFSRQLISPTCAS